MQDQPLAFLLLLSGLLSGCGVEPAPAGADTGSDTAVEGAPDADGDGTPDGEDCAPEDPRVHPGAEEVCNGLDDNCDGTIDADATDRLEGHVDADGDGFGAAAQTGTFCEGEAGWAPDGTDCDDTDARAFPGAAEEAPEACMRDGDGDGFGDAAAAAPVEAGTDCDDTDARAFPGAAEEAPEACMRDGDGDGFGDAAAAAPVEAGTDCNDADADTYPGAPEDDPGLLEDPACDGGMGQTSDAELILEGVSPFVETVAGGKDVDGDAVPDLLLGSPSNRPNVTAAQFVSGANLAAAAGRPLLSDLVGVTFTMSEARQRAGEAVALLDDRDGDGLAEPFIGVPLWVYGGAGITHFSTSLAALAAGEDWDGRVALRQVPDPPTADLVFYTEGSDVSLDDDGAQLRHVGTSIHEGDLDGDGLTDLVLGVPGQGPSGRADPLVLVYLGSTLARPHAAPWTLSEADLVVRGMDYPVRSTEGYGVSVAPDVDGDGRSELVVGTGQRLCLFLGASLMADADARVGLDDADLELSGLQTLTVDAAGDLDGDGRSDLLVATEDNGAMLWTGATLVALLAESTESPGPESADMLFIGLSAEPFGRRARFAGDLDGDGLDDVTVLGNYSVGPSIRPSLLWAARGNQLRGWAGEVPVEAVGYRIDQADGPGVVRAEPVGDLDGDGRDDLAVVLMASGYSGVMVVSSRL